MPARYSEARVPTAFGLFRLRVYGAGAVAIIAGDGLDQGPARIHRACFLSENLGYTGCECRERLTSALASIAARGGVVIYIRPHADGRGVAEQLRNRGADHQRLDAASVETAAGVLRDLGVNDQDLTCTAHSST